METVKLKVAGMSCMHCVKTIEATVRDLDGVAAVSVDLKANEAKIEFSPEEIQLSAIISAISEAGYEASAQ